MEEMQEALRGKNRLNVAGCMLSDAKCSFSTDSLDDRALKDESSQKDSSTVISEVSSTKTLINIDYDAKLASEQSEVSNIDFLSRRHSDSMYMDIERNIAAIQYSWQINPSYKEQMTSDLILRLKDREKNEDYMRTYHHNISPEYKKRNFNPNFNDFPPSKYDRKIQKYFYSSDKKITSTDSQKSLIFLSPIEKNNETPSDQNKLDTKMYKTSSDKSIFKPTYSYKRKYHTYPKSRIPVLKSRKERRIENYPMNPQMFPLEPREIDLEFFQQLHTADSQEELQEFLLLESQCKGNLGLAGNVPTSYDEYCTEDEKDTMSGRI